MVELSGSVIDDLVAHLDAGLLRRVEGDRHHAASRGDPQHRPGLHRRTLRRGHARHPDRARLEHHRPEGQLPGRRQVMLRLEPLDRKRRRRGERVAARRAVAAQVAVQLGDVRASRHPRHERARGRHTAVEKERRLTTDRVQRLAAADDLPDLRQHRVHRVLAVRCRRGLALGERRLRGRERPLIGLHLAGRGGDALAVRRHRLSVGRARAGASAALLRAAALGGVAAAAVDRELAQVAVQRRLRLRECTLVGGERLLRRCHRLLRLLEAGRRRPARHRHRRGIGIAERRAHLRLLRQILPLHRRQRGGRRVVG